MSVRLLSARQAAELGVERLRKPVWANALDHLKIDILEDGQLGPWLHLYAPFNQECNGRDPVDICWPLDLERHNPDAECFVAYRGPLPDSAEYKAAAKQYEGITEALGGDGR